MKKKTPSTDLALPSKHGVHVPPRKTPVTSVNQDPNSIDPEDPLNEAEPDQLLWESDEERTLRDESEDPDAPATL
jgi:hypothetical protein